MKKAKSTLAIILVLLLLVVTGSTSALALEVSNKNVSADLFNPDLFANQGSLKQGETPLNKEELFQKALQKPGLTAEKKLAILKKAAYAGVDLNKVSENTVSSDQIAAVQNDASIMSVTMPSYVLWPTTIMQETNVWCSAATIQTALKYIKGPSGFTTGQSTIMTSVGSGPSLQTVVNYTNNYLPDSYADYIRVVFGGNRDIFDAYLAYDVLHYQPMIFTMANQSSYSTSVWLFRTNGHFVVCNGYGAGPDQVYSFSDPYYFTKYVSGATVNNGKLHRTFSQLNEASRRLHGTGNQAVGF